MKKSRPEPPLTRVIRECSTKICDICSSTMTRTGFLHIFGKYKCDNPKCKNSKI